MIRPLIAVLAALVPFAAAAQSVTSNAADIKAGAYKVDPDHTQIMFSVLHLGFSYYAGMFSHVSGTLRIDPARPQAAALAVTVPVSSLYTTSPVLNRSLLNANWFDAAAYPAATFVSTRIAVTGRNTADVTGNLTLHGITKPETLAVTFVGAGSDPLVHEYTIGFEATATIKRGDFGIETYIPIVGNDVRLTLTGEFVKG